MVMQPINLNQLMVVQIRIIIMRATTKEHLINPPECLQHFQRLGCSPFSLVWKRNLVLFVFDAHLAKQRRCGTRIFVKIYVIHHVLKLMNTLHVQMTEVAVLKFKRTISRWCLYQIGHIHFMHLHKIYFVQVAFA